MADSTEFLTMMAGLDDAERRSLMARHLQTHGDVSMTESLRPLVADAEELEIDVDSPVWSGLPGPIVEAFTDGNLEHRNLVIEVWNTWVEVVDRARSAGEVPEPSTTAPSTRSSGASAVAPADVSGGQSSADSSSRCPSCGVPSSGLCNRCENKEILDDHIEYDRRLYEIDQDRIEHDRLRDDRSYQDTTPSYDPGYDTSYDPSYDDY